MKSIFDPGLIFYLPLYECDGSALMSRDARGHLCTVTGAVWRHDGRYFDGSDDKVISGFNVLEDYPFTLAVWMKAETEGYVSALSIGNNAHTSKNFFMGQADDSSGRAMLWVRNTTPYKIHSSNSIVDGTWHFLVGLYHNPSLREMYLDARYQGNSSSYGGTYASIGVNELAVGCIVRSAHAGFWDGTIGEVFIFNRALTPQEIHQNYLATKWKYQ